jgi:hypothetical protein
MAVVVASATTFSVAANTKSAEQVTGDYMFIGKGKLTLAARASVTGMNITLAVGGVPVINDSASAYFGATGALSINDHVVCSQIVNGGKVSLTFRNTTGGAVTVDYLLLFEPMK